MERRFSETETEEFGLITRMEVMDGEVDWWVVSGWWVLQLT